MDAICIATIKAELAIVVPVVTLPCALWKVALVSGVGWPCFWWAWNIQERFGITKAAFHMNSICVASFLSDFAGGIPEVRNVWLRREGTLLDGARDVCIITGAAESALPMPTICFATFVNAFGTFEFALRFPVVFRHRGNWKIASLVLRHLCILRALGDVGHISTKATLFVEAIGPAAQVPQLAVLIPVVWDARLVRENTLVGIVSSMHSTEYQHIDLHGQLRNLRRLWPF